MDKNSIKIAKSFAKRIRQKYKPQKVILFGSRARGDNFNQSDFDFIIVSEKFSKINFLFRASDIYRYWKEDVDIEPICYTPEEFEIKRKQYGTVRQAVKEGIEL